MDIEKKVSYFVDDCGELHIHYGNYEIADVSGCEAMEDKAIESLVEEVLYDLGYIWLDDGTLKEAGKRTHATKKERKGERER